MKLSIKLYVGILGLVIIVCILLFLKGSIFTQNSSNLLQDANTLLSKGITTHDNNLIYQAKDKISTWLEKNWNNPDKKIVANSLRTRGSIFLSLDDTDKAINDYIKSIQYDPSGSLQLIICNLEKEQGNSSVLHGCYSKAVAIFTKKHSEKTDVHYLIARILSGDKSAIIDYKNTIQTLTEKTKMIYEMEVKAFLGPVMYEEIIK